MAIAFIPEDGTGLPDANSYLSVTDYKEIADLFGYDYSTLTDDVIERYLIRSTIVMDAEYRNMFPGERAVTGQALEWPREDAKYVDGEEISKTVVPKEIRYALTEMMEIIKAGTSLQPVISPTGVLKEERVKVDVIEESKKYNTDGLRSTDTYRTVEDALSRITGGVAGYAILRLQVVGGGS